MSARSFFVHLFWIWPYASIFCSATKTSSKFLLWFFATIIQNLLLFFSVRPCFAAFVSPIFWSINFFSVIIHDFGSVRSSQGRIRSDPSSTIYLLYLYRVYWIAQDLQGTLACKPPFTLVFSHLVIPSSCRDSLLLLSVLSSSRHDEFGFPLLFITSCHPSVISSSWLFVFLLQFLRIRFFAHYYLRFVLSTPWGTKTRLSL